LTTWKPIIRTWIARARSASLTIPEHAGALDAFRLMGRLDCPRLIVVDPAGRMTGIVSEGDLVRAI